MTTATTQVKDVEQINRIADKGTIELQLSEHTINKLKRSWEQNETKQRHKLHNNTALNTTQDRTTKDKMIRKIQRRVTTRTIKRQNKLCLEGTAVMDSGTTSTIIQPKDNKYVINTEEPSNKIFTIATGEQMRAGNQAKLRINLRGQTTDADMVPTLRHNSLISTSKLADANYCTVFTPNEVLVCDGEVEPTKIPIWKGWRDKETGLWRIPLTNDVTNINTQTKLLQCEEMIQAFQEHTLSVYTLRFITYLHAALGFPTKETLLAATRAGFLTSWPGMTVTAINKHFPESIETQKGPMKHQRQGVRSTKVPQLRPGITEQE
jgi:hypothetical protein